MRTKVVLATFFSGLMLAAVLLWPDPVLAQEPVDLALSKSVDNASPGENQPAVYTVSVTNLSLAEATGVVVSDTLPVSVTLITSDTTVGSYDPFSGLWTITEAITPGNSVTLTLAVQVNSDTAGQTITNTATISAADQEDPDTDNNTASAAFTVPLPSPGVDLVLSKSVDNATPGEGEPITYTISLANQSLTETATGVVVSDTLPVSVSFVTSDTTAGSYDPFSGLWTLDSSLASGESVTLTLAVVNLGTAGQTITNTATISAADQEDPDTDNNTASAAFTVFSPSAGADLAVSKISEPNPVAPGEALTYTVSISNQGPEAATVITLSDNLPAGVNFALVSPDFPVCVEASGSITCTLGPLDIGAMTDITIVVTPTQSGTITNTVSVEGLEADPDLDNNTATISTTVGLESVIYLPIIYKEDEE